ncbi:unnamed protein product [Ceutorhynchus assimilis]|uniref:FAM192A/Fyv6 N-terminal domain-containing protein n=1 Tax=Ceutorhynchus assimilis TaxID=467358 RepID=A0A9N9QDL4_9CUCU|nr:unnamed protein product [Ceutorhynchus assimilis]
MSSKFISETEAAEVRKKRQEEWEKVRKPSDPVERPEEPYDNRSLFDRLQEQKQKKDLEYEEAHKLKNMIKTLDDDEVEFLDLVDRTKLAADRKKEIEEEQELKDFRNRVAVLQEKSIEERLQAEIVVNNKPKADKPKQKLLKGVVVKKSEGLKRKMTSSNEEVGQAIKEKSNDSENSAKQQKISENDSKGTTTQEVKYRSALKCVAVLPGLGYYGETSSESDSSSESEIDAPPTIDILGKKIGIPKIMEK